MRNGDLFDALERFCTGGDVVDGVQDLGAVVTKSTRITDANRNSFEDDKPFLMFEGLTVDFFSANGTLTMFAQITVAIVLSGIS